jgi:hypothetical protein
MGVRCWRCWCWCCVCRCRCRRHRRHSPSLSGSTPISPCEQWLAGWVEVLYQDGSHWGSVVVRCRCKSKEPKNENENVI